MKYVPIQFKCFLISNKQWSQQTLIWFNIGSMLVHFLWSRSNIELALGQCLVFAGFAPRCSSHGGSRWWAYLVLTSKAFWMAISWCRRIKNKVRRASHVDERRFRVILVAPVPRSFSLIYISGRRLCLTRKKMLSLPMFFSVIALLGSEHNSGVQWQTTVSALLRCQQILLFAYTLQSEK